MPTVDMTFCELLDATSGIPTPEVGDFRTLYTRVHDMFREAFMESMKDRGILTSAVALAMCGSIASLARKYAEQNDLVKLCAAPVAEEVAQPV